MKRRQFIRTVGLAAAGTAIAPYILPSGRLFAATGSRIANHVVFVLFAGGIRNQESVYQQYLANQGLPTQGNVMENMLAGTAPSSNLVYNRWNPVLSQALSTKATLFKEMSYAQGPTGHFNGHTVAMTGNYTSTGLNLNINPEYPTIFEYYRKHSDPAKSAINAWWISEGLGPYPALNYSRHESYGPLYGANFIQPATLFGSLGNEYFSKAKQYQPDDVTRINDIKAFLDKNFQGKGSGAAGIQNSQADREHIKTFIKSTIDKSSKNQVEWPIPTGVNPNQNLTGDLINIAYAWQVLDEFAPELTVINTFNLDICHSNFSSYLQFLHKADYGVGWLWNKIQNHPTLANDTIMICMPEHGRNGQPNNLSDGNGLKAYDHTSDDNSRRTFALVVGPAGKVKQGQVLGNIGSPAAESIDIAPTIAHILGFDKDIPSGFLPGRALTEAFS